MSVFPPDSQLGYNHEYSKASGKKGGENKDRVGSSDAKAKSGFKSQTNKNRPSYLLVASLN